MKNIKQKLFAILLLAFSFNQGFAQQSTNASGGDVSGGGGSIAYSVGQIIYTTFFGNSGSVAQGIQQPYEISTTSEIVLDGININLNAYPNPTVDFLTLDIDNYGNNMFYQLFDINGKLLESKQVTQNATIVTMNKLANATYFLRITQNKKEIKTFKILKK